MTKPTIMREKRPRTIPRAKARLLRDLDLGEFVFVVSLKGEVDVDVGFGIIEGLVEDEDELFEGSDWDNGMDLEVAILDAGTTTVDPPVVIVRL